MKLFTKASNPWIPQMMLVLKGFFMGAADVIPGVSGGTIAFIMGIYEELIESISNYDAKMIGLLLRGQWKELWKRMNLGFLLPLGGGILFAIFSLARLMTYLLNHHEMKTFAVFFGLVLGSVFLMIRKFKASPVNYGILLIGAVATFLLVGLLPVETPATLLAYFLSAVVAICAMILPGISGSFILLVLGKYRQVMEVIKHPFEEGNLLIIFVFGMGALIGIVSFTKLLKWLLKYYHDALFAFLIGMMVGSLRKLWPFADSPQVLSIELLWRILLIFAGLGAVLLIQKLEEKNRERITKIN